MMVLDFCSANDDSRKRGGRIRDAWEGKREAVRSRASKRYAGRFPSWLRRKGDGYELIPERADLVKQIYAKAQRGVGVNSICRQLNQDRIPPFGKAKTWKRSSVERLLSNPAVYGVLQPHEIIHGAVGKPKKVRQPVGDPIPNFFPAIIPERAFLAVQAKRGLRSMVPPSRDVRSIVGGLLQCGTCGGSMTRYSKGPRGGPPRIVCIAARERRCPNRVPIIYEKFETMALAALPRLLREAPVTSEGVAEQKLEAHDSRVEGVSHALNHLLAAVERTGATPTIAKRIIELEQLQITLAGQRKALEIEVANSSNAVWVRQIHALGSSKLLAQPMKPEQRAELAARLKTIIERVVLDTTTGIATVDWRAGGASSFLFAFPPQ
jgi:hypothetical protein